MGGCIIYRACAAFEDKALIEHSHASVDVFCCPTAAYVDVLQIATSPEHVGHVSNVLGVEGGEIERRQRLAVLEQALHVCHLAGDEVLEAFNLFQIGQTIKPIEQICWSYGDERRIEDYFLYVQILIRPFRLCYLIWQVVHRANFLRLLAVGIEGHHAGDIVKNDVGGILDAGEVAGVSRGDVDVGVGGIDVAAAERCAVTADELCAAREHIRRRGHGLCRPVGPYGNGLQARAAVEHIAHVGDVRRIEHFQIESTDTVIVLEHAAHAGDVRRGEAFMMGDGINDGRGASV